MDAFEPPVRAGTIPWRQPRGLAAHVRRSDLGSSPFTEASARANVRREPQAPPPRGSQGVLMWVIKSFAMIHLEQQPCLTRGVMMAPQIERWSGRQWVGPVPRAGGRPVQTHSCYQRLLAVVNPPALCLPRAADQSAPFLPEPTCPLLDLN